MTDRQREPSRGSTPQSAPHTLLEDQKAWFRSATCKLPPVGLCWTLLSRSKGQMARSTKSTHLKLWQDDTRLLHALSRKHQPSVNVMKQCVRSPNSTNPIRF
jgi:hypothetical protein